MDKKVPIALIIAMCVQTGTFLTVGTAWVTATNMRLDNLEVSNSKSVETRDRLILIESSLKLYNDRLDRLGNAIRELLTSQHKPELP